MIDRVALYVCPAQGCGFVALPWSAGATTPSCPGHRTPLVLARFDRQGAAIESTAVEESFVEGQR